ncbi:Hint domain-containing protein [Donghicola mangrovi]|uniref:Hint domain-containing protein n=1 Tax=Donghicola mangrovi TaxID=2729614 RepID=A0A850QCC5_9RHOB|nr:Hint domain-containing protein [Donghicola mangrovi]NVO24085.1 Hint domain-containing protein [Donghicola mangrovi]
MAIAGTFVIQWAQTEIDGVTHPDLSDLATGATWRWTGELTRVDGPRSVLQLTDPEGDAHLRRGAAGMVRRLIGDIATPQRTSDLVCSGTQCLTVTDGTSRHTARIVRSAASGQILLCFDENYPKPDRDYWVMGLKLEDQDRTALSAPVAEAPAGVICFGAGTRIDTPKGPRRVETLQPGDYVLTRDSGVQQVLWTGSRRMSGARLFAMPHLRPVRIHASAFGADRPDETLIVSPEHRLLVQGDAARALFNTPEVMVQARDLVNDRTIICAADMKEVTYVHILLSRHEVIWANGIECESFHPATASMDALDQGDRMALEQLLPWVGEAPMRYGDFVRRPLSRSEAAILVYDT